MSEVIKGYKLSRKASSIDESYLLNYILPVISTVSKPLEPLLNVDEIVYEIDESIVLKYETMLKLHKSNILSIIDEKAFPICAKCDSFSLHVELSCPYCKEKNKV